MKAACRIKLEGVLHMRITLIDYDDDYADETKDHLARALIPGLKPDAMAQVLKATNGNQSSEK
jgi:hypothetical protein